MTVRRGILRMLEVNENCDLPEDITLWGNLDISNRRMTKLPSSIDKCVNLKLINISGNELTTLPPSIAKLKHLKCLDISRNLFKELPVDVCDVPCLEELNVGRNHLIEMPPDVGRMTKLKTLDIFMNEFCEFPEYVCDLTQLENLDLGRNKIANLPERIRKLASLRTLKIYGNEFTEFPEQILGFTLLEDLDVSANNIKTVPEDIGQLTSLKIFDISWNALEDFPIHICLLSQLIDIRLNKNKIGCIPKDIRRLTELKSLNIDQNVLEEFPVDLCHLKSLEALSMEWNNIPEVPERIAKLQKLKTISLNYNKITHLPEQLEHLGSLEELHVIGNPLIQPPESVCENGKDAIFRFLRGLRETRAVKASRLQLNLLGEPTGGKSSLSKSLQKGKPILTEEADRTHVIELAAWSPDEEVSFNINDFGGHDVYKVGFPIFIHKNGVSLVVFDLSAYQFTKEHYEKHVGNWVRTVQSRTPETAVTIVGTHLDKVEESKAKEICDDLHGRLKEYLDTKGKWMLDQIFNLERKVGMEQVANSHLCNLYKQKIEHLRSLEKVATNVHKKIFLVSSADMTGYSELIAHLMSLAKERGVILPGIWVNVMHEMERIKYEPTCNTLALKDVGKYVRNVLREYQESPVDEYKDACPAGGSEIADGPKGDVSISEEDIACAVEDILRYMSSSGEVIWFDTSTTLRQVIFHKPELLADLLKSVLNHDVDQIKQNLLAKHTYSKNTFENILQDVLQRGIISRDVMSRLWHSFQLSTGEQNAMIELMQNLELCYRIEGASSVAKNSDTFHFPWLLTETKPHDLESPRKWPEKFSPDTFQLSLETYTPYRCPDGLFEKLSVRLHRHLGMFTKRRCDWKDGVYAESAAGTIHLRRHQVSSDWVITVAVRGKQLPRLWEMLLKLHRDQMDILQYEWPGVSYDKYLLCPHCVRESNPFPTTFPGEILDDPEQDVLEDFLPCDFAPDGCIPSTLVYPAISGHHGMTKEHKNMLRGNKVDFVMSLTEPGVREILDRLRGEGIFTGAEAELIVECCTQQERAETLLDIIRSKEDRAFFILRDYLKNSGQKHLANLLSK
ncbi:malignant fibrous histiocytoma-amplified sequence 1 homolog [Lingula anatina]|uniref:Malignant fibrous histiocytoma-amplified sequence 1 homolog n=1 Tax=Lingula anatina TaxID=7574 RepID=A0A1S3K3B2_LINAN|nr:malignant fibrous histiocytoma-amplified sequence 1 homolog [Lingula anatina]|eukprot:XP_013417012.1 malignant fibrous histiocytoma-amplified sequence 1 homolog [Lingula anatina]